MPREPEKKRDETVEEKLAKDRDFTLISLPRNLYGTAFYLAFSPALAPERIPRLMAAQANFYPVAYVKGGGATIQHLSNVDGYDHVSLAMLSPNAMVIVFYDRPDYNGYRFIAQAVTGVDNAAHFSPGYGPTGEVERITRGTLDIRQEIADVKEAIKAQT